MTKVTDLSTVIVIPIGDTAAASGGLRGGFLTYLAYYCACTHDGYKVINTILVVVL